MFNREGKNFTIKSTVKNKSRIPKRFRDLPFEQIVEKIIGKDAEVSIVLIGKSKMKSLNRKFRDKNYATDVLSFPLTNGGEIFICEEVCRSKCNDFDLELHEYLSYILIHALLHLKGFDHSSKMNMQEKKFCTLFKLSYPK